MHWANAAVSIRLFFHMLIRVKLALAGIGNITVMFGYAGHDWHDIVFIWTLTLGNLGITELDQFTKIQEIQLLFGETQRHSDIDLGKTHMIRGCIDLCP